MKRYDVVVDIAVRERDNWGATERAALRLRYPIESIADMDRATLGEELVTSIGQVITKTVFEREPETPEEAKP